MAMQLAPNKSDEISSVVFFELSHVDHEALKSVALDSLWCEFEAFNELPEDVKADCLP